MGNSRHGLGLSQHAEALIALSGRGCMQKLEGDFAIELFVVSGKDAAHATCAELAEQDKAPKALSYLHVGGILWSRAR